MEELVVELTRVGCESLEFRLCDITPQSIGHAFQVRGVVQNSEIKFAQLPITLFLPHTLAA